MRRLHRSILTLAAISFLAACCFLWWLTDPFEPQFAGRRDSEIALVAAQPSPPNHIDEIRVAGYHLTQIGATRAVPALTTAYVRAGAGWRGILMANPNTVPLSVLRRSPWGNQFLRATSAEIWRRRVIRQRTVQLLTAYGPASVHALSVIFHQAGDGVEKREALSVLIGIGLPAVPELQALAAKERDVELLSLMLEELRRLSPGAELASLPRLLKWLSKDDDARVRAHSAALIGWLGPEAKAAEPHLRKAQGDPAGIVRDSARQALQAVGAANLPDSGASQ